MSKLIEINAKCVQCDLCRLVCPENAVLKQLDKYSIDEWSCSLCQICIELCPVDSIKLNLPEVG